MRNFTFSRSKLFRLNFLTLFLLLITYNASAQFYTKHYIAPAPWQYFSKANEIVIATNSTATVSITVAKSDGTLVTTLTATKGAPAVYRFEGKPSAAPAFALNTVLNASGLIVTGDAPISINLRNVASDALGGDGTDKDIKGNAALTSFGDAGIGIRFRVGYYRDGSLGNFNNYGDQRPIYSIMAITNGTSVTIDGVVKATLDAGQSYLFKATIGTLVQSSNPTVMNTSAAIDTPGGCGDGAYNQIPPESVLGSEYFIERGKGNDTAEQTTVVATKDNTTVTVDSYSATGVLTKTTTTVLATAGKFFTFLNGNSNTNFSASRVSADKNVAVYSGTAQSCEVDISTIAPVSECGGSNFIETAKFRNYGTGSLPYFGYILLKDAASVVNVNGVNIETVSGISPRHQLGSTGWYIINFEDTQIGSPNVLSISSLAKLTVSIVQQGGGFSMAGFFSNFAAQPEDPTMTYVSGGGCTNNTATLTTPSDFAPYQWYFNGTAITGANSNSYVATKTGSYSVASTLACGVQTQSKPVSVTLCTDLGVTKTVDNATPCVGSNVEFTVKLSNLGVNNATGVSINDLLPSGYNFVSATPSVGSYNSGTGVWSIGDVNGGITETLKIIAKVNATGNYNNTAALPSTTTDSNLANNSASVSTTPNPLPTLVITNPASVCSPSKVDITAPAITAGSSSDLTFTYWTNSTATTSYATPTAAIAGTYYIKATTTSGCSDIKPVVVTVNTTPAAPTASAQTFCSAEAKTVNDLVETGSNKKWYNASTAGTLYTGTELLATGTYYVSQTSASGCESARTSVAVTVNTTPVAPTASAQTFCSAEAKTVNDLVATGSNKKWYNANTGGTLYTGTELLATGTYYVSQTSASGCESARTSVAVTVNTTPVAPTATPQTFCSADTKKVSDLVATGTNLKWYNASTGGTLYTGTELLATGTYYVSQTSASSCESARTSVSVIVNATPAQPLLSSVTQQTCSTATGSFTITNYNASYTYVISPSTGVSQAGNTITAPAGNYTIIAKANNCESLSTSATVDSKICANVDNTYPTQTASATTNTIGNVTTNDTLNGLPVTAANTNVTPITNGPLSIDANGELTLDPNTKSGTYTITYTICEEGANPINCTSNTATVVVENTIIANVDNTYPTQTASATTTTIGNVTANDTLNGLPVTAANTNVTPITNGPLSIDANGELTLDPNTKSGTYTITYTICEEGANPVNCASNTATVVVENTLIANVDNTYPVQTSSATTATIGNVTTNDTLNGLPVTAANTNVTPITNGPLSIDANGELTLDPNTKSGTYTITYTICEEGANPINCASNTATVVVENTLVANVDNTYPTQTSSTTTTTIGNVTTNDTLNGLAVTAANTNVTPITNGPLSIDANGELTLDPNTKSGTYTITYTICEEGANPANCASNTATVVVENTLVANVDNTYPTQTSSATTTTIGNVTTNDTLNGLPVTAANTNVTPITNGPLSIDANGELTLDPNTKSGTYTITYTICEEGANPANCASNTATVVVENTIIANVDNTYPAQTASATTTTVGNVTSNDTLNGLAVTSLNTNVTPITNGPLSIDANGELTLDPNTKSGTYTITYTICEEGANPANCASNTATVIVENTIIANVDNTYPTQTASATTTTIGNVTTNDTLNGLPVTAANTSVTPITNGPLSIDANGELTLDPNTKSGTYTITYTICEEGANPINCASNTATVVVENTIIANVDNTYPTQTASATTTTIGNVTANDTLNGLAVTAANTNVTPITNGPLSIDANGELILDPNTKSGTYTITYTICEEGANPANCASNTATVVVENTIIANADNTYPMQTSSATTTTIGNVTTNDTLNGLPVTAANTSVTPITNGPLSIDANGELTLAPNTPSGTYTIIYELCEVGATTPNCTTGTVTVIVKGTINAVTENTLPINGSIGGTTLSLINNDTLNGSPAIITNNPGGVILKPVNIPTGLILNSNGTITVNAGTPIGIYEVEYSICEYVDQTNCSTVKSYVPVTGAVLQANNDNAGTVDSNKGQTSTTNIFNNDTLNGLALNPTSVILTTVVSNPNLILKADGTIEVKPGTPIGNYELTYQICEVLNPSNCSQAVIKISVVNNVGANPPATPLTQIVLTNDGLINVDGINGSLEFINVLDNDLLKGLPINSMDVVIANTPKNNYFEFNADGTVNVKPNTPGGNYSLVYQVCEKSNPTNCATATLDVFVEVPAIGIIKTAVFNDENSSGFANAGETITYKFKVTNTGNVPLRGIMVSDPLPGVIVSGQAIDLAVNESDENNFIATYKITQNDINKGSVSNQASVKGTSNRGVVVEDISDNENNNGDKPTVMPLNGCVIKVFNAFSPNGDQKNSRFYIQGLECYPDNTVEIYNRWGVLVYDIDKYNNEDRVFTGFSEGRTTVKQTDGLPVGTYFYILKYKDSGSNLHEMSGYLYINK
ncbi:hypothetical protein ASF10_03225 [Flavobacterium sp. Leaf82]|uniref:Ig-like domain-containing protein n=1 Tax=Flavobacterium sp. Leaf82 TaxID=1736238 RepID=UPI0007159872|nr:gliding motility-associated C-terminal domain-containing protein [Flavobacterium sp. Leaf82]KQO34735.1 hypothetical protein ASF10_03225 [Flavobacterium sp. Leaf82]